MSEQKRGFLPLMLSTKGKDVVVIGGGQVATRRIAALLEAEGNVDVISPDVTEDIKRLHEEKRLQWKAKRFEKSDIKDAAIIVAATNDSHVNIAVYEAAEKHQLINVCDRPDLSQFFFPATVRRGKLLLSVSTSGASPSLSRHIRQQLSIDYDEKYEEYVDFLYQCRSYVRSTGLSHRSKNNVLKELLHSRFREMNSMERDEAFKQLLVRYESIKF